MTRNTFIRKYRHRARRLALQALYQWHYNEESPDHLLSVMLARQPSTRLDTYYFEVLVKGVLREIGHIDCILQPLLDRNLMDLNPVELAILRLSTFELLYQTAIPYRIIINEGVELAKIFGASEGYKYVNAVLDNLASQHRSLEQKTED